MDVNGGQIISLLIVLLALSSCADSQAGYFSISTDLSALLAFKAAISHDPNNVLADWSAAAGSFCDWVGVSCSRRRQRVTALRLPNSGLGGTISPQLTNLSFLRVLDLRNNSFHGRPLESLTRLRRLESLNLSRNAIEGEIPASIRNFQKLRAISISKNKLSGGIPVELTALPLLTVVFLGTNNLTGKIPPFLGNMSKLEWLGMERNQFHGTVPDEISQLINLKGINLWGNHLTGSLPSSIFNISSLEQVLLSENAFTGSLPPTTGLLLPNLQKLNVDINQFSGEIPVYISNCTKLDELELSNNQFTGPVPRNLGQLSLLQSLFLANNMLTISPPPGKSELEFLTDLTNCSLLEFLVIDNNPFNGTLPSSIGNLPSSLGYFGASGCQLRGQIPDGIGNLKVNLLVLSDNNLEGRIPTTIGRIDTLQRLYLGRNRMEGSIPDEACSLHSLGELYLHNNKLSGPIPSCIGNLGNLQVLFLDSNKLNSSIPKSLWNLENLSFLNLSSNLLVGPLDQDIKPLKGLESMDLSWNRLSGEIPSAIGDFQSLVSLNLSRNSFWGPIPELFGSLITLDFLDLSHNGLSGTIPKSLEALSHLKFLNLSSNKLAGEIPSQGPFRNLTVESFVNNEALCGGQPTLQVPSCSNGKTNESWARRFFTISAPAVAALLVISVSVLYALKKYGRTNMHSLYPVDLSPVPDHRVFSYQELRRATKDFSEDNLIGLGSSGSVYKAILPDGQTVAVKILNLQLEGAYKRFDAECSVLRAVRHRNLVKVISVCSNTELRALVLQYMPNGSLESWLYSHEHYYLGFFQRLSIMIDVALALEYLHHAQEEPVVHCDLKPSNVLLDEHMVAHVADFGIAKILAENKNTIQTKTLGTLGYIAPEYGSEGKVSTKGDVYSYGIMLLEAFTGKKPTHEMFGGGLNLREWVKASLSDSVMDILDGNLVAETDSSGMVEAKDHVLAIIELGLNCSKEVAEERVHIEDVLSKLKKIKHHLLSMGYA
ncbi:putative receptor-like protein kinase At3g47110 [Diospyros lotus]|uniref:putative receptor-like protein kinase At3g47110 n=1 Tax=Diospyros lotus TaxID=55363 RepID=UPI00225BE8FD|nr:putative receptor-like protein kinase At3g47110 [Diospyros lotus]